MQDQWCAPPPPLDPPADPPEPWDADEIEEPDAAGEKPRPALVPDETVAPLATGAEPAWAKATVRCPAAVETETGAA